MADAEATPAEGEEVEVKAEVPEDLRLRWFTPPNEALSDCTIKLPPPPEGAAGGEEAAPPPQAEGEEGAEGGPDDGKPKTEWKCHKIILASCSDFFHQKFVIDQEGDEIEIPTLPDDAIFRESVNLSDCMSLILRYAYNNQDWDEIAPDIEDPRGLFITATILKMRPLVEKLLVYLEEQVLDAQAYPDITAASLYYHACLLGPTGEALKEKARARILEQYTDLSEDDKNLLARLPIQELLGLLNDDDLNVQEENEVSSLVLKVLRTRLPKRVEQTMSLKNLKLSDPRPFVNEPVLWELVVCEGGEQSIIPLTGEFFRPENEKYTCRTSARLDIQAGTTEAYPFPEEEGYALDLVLPARYSANVAALTAPSILIRAIKEKLPEGAGDAGEAGDGGSNNPAATVKVDSKLKYTVVAEGIIPKAAFCPEPTSPSARRKMGFPPLEDKKAAEKKEGEEDAAEGAEGGGEQGETPEVVHFVSLTLKDVPKGELSFTVDKLEPVGGEGEGGEGEAAAEPAAPVEGEEGAEEGAVPEVKANLPLTPNDVDALLDSVRFPFLHHENLVQASRDPIIHEADAAHLVVEALSNRLCEYEPIDGGKMDVRPRNSMLQAMIPSGKKSTRSTRNPLDYKQLLGATSPLKAIGNDIRSTRMGGNTRINALASEVPAKPTGVVVATVDTPLTFEHEKNFDENGLLYYLATGGKKAAWKNPSGAGQVRVIHSEIGFGTPDVLVGREAANLRTGNPKVDKGEPHAYMGVDLLRDRLLLISGYCLRGRNAKSHALLTWELQGSNAPEGQKTDDWVTLDQHVSDKTLYDPKRDAGGLTGYFEVNPQNLPRGKDENNIPKGAFRQFRVVMTGVNSAGSWNLGLSGIELYGSCLRGSFPF